MASESEKAGRAMRSLIERTMRRFQFRCYQVLTSASPVLTGFFRSRWSVETGDRPHKAVGRPNDAALARSQAESLFSAHRAASEALANGYVLSQGPIFIVNDTEYGIYLNAGSSAQAPAMFVERSVQVAIDATRRELRA